MLDSLEGRHTHHTVESLWRHVTHCMCKWWMSDISTNALLLRTFHCLAHPECQNKTFHSLYKIYIMHKLFVFFNWQCFLRPGIVLMLLFSYFRYLSNILAYYNVFSVFIFTFYFWSKEEREGEYNTGRKKGDKQFIIKNKIVVVKVNK